MKHTLTMEQMNIIYSKVSEFHNMIKGRHIKYIETIFDTRFSDIYLVRFRCNGAPNLVEFTTTNRVEEHVNLYQEILDWLEEKE